MLPVQNSLSNLLSSVEGWTHSSKAVIVGTLFIFAAIPLTVIGVFSLRTFTPSASVSKPTKLTPSGTIQTNSPLFTWECNCSAKTYRISLKEGDSNFESGSWQKDVPGIKGVNTSRYGGWYSLNYPKAPETLSTGKAYYWSVSCVDGSCSKSDPVQFLIKSKDSEKPTVPYGLKITDIGQNSFTLVWNQSSDNVEVTGYQVLEEISGSDAKKNSVTTNSFQIAPYIGFQKYSFSVAAVDEAGNLSDFSQKIAYTAPDKDSDKDGFMDSTEAYIRTDVNVSCGGFRSWPPDINDDGVVNDADIQLITKHIGEVRSSVSSSASRYDLDKDGIVTVKDVNIVKSYLGKTC